MEMTLRDILNKINHTLGNPSLDWTDVVDFFDYAISDLNSTLHTSLKPITYDINFYLAHLKEELKSQLVKIKDDDPNPFPMTSEEDALAQNYLYFYNNDSSDEHYKLYGFRKNIDSSFTYVERLYGQNKEYKYFYAFFNGETVTWEEYQFDPLLLDLTHFLPSDWIILWLIPYVCFKYTVRDGGTAEIFANEYSQGFIQLQNAYDIKEKYPLHIMAGKYAYIEDVEEHAPYLNVMCPTRAIYEWMKHKRAIGATYGSMYDRNGWNEDHFDNGWRY